MYRSEQQDMFDDPDMNWSETDELFSGQILNSTLFGLVVEEQKRR